VEAGAPEADPELGLADAAGCDDFSRVRRGGASLSPLFNPTGTFSALCATLAGAVPLSM
jgi:hypothetical protein